VSGSDLSGSRCRGTGNLRANWPLVPLRYLVRFLSGGTPGKGNADFWSGGTIPWVSPKDMKVDRIRDSEDHITEAALDGSATQVVPVGSVLVVVRGMILAHTLPVAVTVGSVTINQDIKALVCGERIMPEFLHAVLAGQAEWLLSQADSSAHGTKKLETEVLQRFEVPCPPLQQQRRIVATMQAQAMRLDEVAAAKQRLLDLLAEKRKAIIATAVTRGIDPEARMAPTGIEWIPEAPSHWRLSRIGRLFRQSKTLGCPELAVLSVYREYGVIERSSRDDNANVLPDDLAKYQLVEADDLVVNKMKAWQGSLGVSGLRGITSPDYVVFRPAHSEFSAYLHFLLRNPRLVPVYLSNSNGIRTNQWRIEPERFLNIPVLLPPLAEQRAIVAHIARETAKLDAVRAATERTIALLKERRSALIAAAVTGQLEVGSAA
jgi:type I restriction enzyme S subunit